MHVSRRKTSRVGKQPQTIGWKAAEVRGKRSKNFLGMNSCLGKRRRTEINAKKTAYNRRTKRGGTATAYECKKCRPLKDGSSVWHVGGTHKRR